MALWTLHVNYYKDMLCEKNTLNTKHLPTPGFTVIITANCEFHNSLLMEIVDNFSETKGMFTTHQIIKSGYCLRVGLGGRLRWFGTLLYILLYCFVFLIKRMHYLFTDGSVVKNLPAMQETQETLVRSLDQEDPMEEEITTYSSIVSWKILWIEEPGGLQSKRSQTVRHNWVIWAQHIVDLQYCVSFRYTAKWFSCKYIYIFFLIFFSIIGYYNILNRVPCTIQ